MQHCGYEFLGCRLGILLFEGCLQNFASPKGKAWGQFVATRHSIRESLSLRTLQLLISTSFLPGED